MGSRHQTCTTHVEYFPANFCAATAEEFAEHFELKCLQATFDVQHLFAAQRTTATRQ